MNEPEEKPKPDWDSFETYKGDDGQSGVPEWVQTIFHWAMVLLAVVLIFGVSGVLLTLVSYRLPGGRANAASETREEFAGRFIGSGAVGLVAALSVYFGKIRKTRI